MDLSEKSCLLLPLSHLSAIGEKSVVQLLLSSYFRLPTSFWDFRLFSIYRRPPEDILATTFQFFPLPTYFRKFRLPMSFWDFRLPTSFRGPSDVFLKKVWKKYLSWCTICPSLSQFEEIVLPPIEVLLRFQPTDVLPRTSRHLFKKYAEKISTLVHNIFAFLEEICNFFVKFAQFLEFSNGSSYP